ncbi:MAG: LysE family translocator [Lapillicoccus sp.]
MPSPSTLAAFSVTALLFVLFPGPAMLFLVARGVAGGPRVGALSAVGVETANTVYVVATALGLTAVLAASTVAFTLIRYAGAAYLVYLGVRTLRDRADPRAPVVASGSLTSWSSWRQGFLVGIGNPKAALFFSPSSRSSSTPRSAQRGRGSSSSARSSSPSARSSMSPTACSAGWFGRD